MGRFECNGAKEVWEANLDAGITIEYQDPHPYFELYYITKGRVRFTILEGFADEAVFVAEAGSIVRIPPYAKHKIEVVEAAQLFDNGCEIRHDEHAGGSGGHNGGETTGAGGIR